MFDSSKVGHSFPPFSIDVERCKIHELALAIGDDNPIYHSRGAAEAANYKDVPLYPTSPTVFHFWGNTQMRQELVEVGIDVMRILHGEEEYEYLAPVYPGDTLTGVTSILSGKSRRGRDGSSMDIVTTETRYTNQYTQHVLSTRTTFVVRS
ncbi:MAG: MaoC family dehydratase [Chloroflexi bacterium]|nr:MAG: MaoC family dehydratase [Chloroflexota bacterium]